MITAVLGLGAVWCPGCLHLVHDRIVFGRERVAMDMVCIGAEAGYF
jgi:hypothetical protein